MLYAFYLKQAQNAAGATPSNNNAVATLALSVSDPTTQGRYNRSSISWMN